MGDLIESPFRLGQDGTPHFRVSIGRNLELLNEEPNDGFQGDTGGRKVNALQRQTLREAVLQERPSDLEMGARVRVGRVPKEIVAENPPISFPVLLVLVTGVLHLEPGAVRGRLHIEPHREPQVAAVIEGQRVNRPVPPSEHEGVGPWPGGEAGGTLVVKDGETQETVGEVSEGLK
jgi:hypothetical protein